MPQALRPEEQFDLFTSDGTSVSSVQAIAMPDARNCRASIGTPVDPHRPKLRQWINQPLLPRPEKYSATLARYRAFRRSRPGLGIWFSHSSQAPGSLGRTLERHRWTLKVGVGRALRGRVPLPRVVEARRHRQETQHYPTRLERALVGDAGCLAGPVTSGVLHQAAGVITDFRAG